jgi:subtilisin family serine protease
VLVALGALAAAVLAAAVGAAQPAVSGEYVPGEVIVRFKPGMTSLARRSVLAAEGLSSPRELKLPGADLVQLPAGQSVTEGIQALEQHEDVLDAQPNFVYHADAYPNDPDMAQLWGLPRIHAPEAWDVATGSRDVVVAVTDTGIQVDHPDLSANIVPGGKDFYSLDDDPSDEYGHGTHVAGTIGAHGNDAVGVAGVNWNVGLLPVRVLGPTGSGTTSMIANGFAYAAAQGAKVVNASLGGGGYDATLEAVINSASNTLFVVAAGNGGADHFGDDNDAGSPVYPCNYPAPNLICVAATDATDTRPIFSNFGMTSVDLAAPGVSILSTWVGSDYAVLSGTSMATPHVAGAAALLWSRNPALTVAQVRADLLGTVDPLGLPVVSGGRLNLQRALAAAAPQASPPPAVVKPIAPRSVKRVKKQPVKVAMCHRGRTIKVLKSNVRKHRKHGDRLGACRKPKKRR